MRSIGAIWSSCSPDFGARSVADRFAQIGPRVLLTVDGYRYGGRDHDRLDVVRSLQEAMPTLERTVVLGYLDPEPSLHRLRDATPWDEFVADGGEEDLTFAQLPFEHSLWVLLQLGHDRAPQGNRPRGTAGSSSSCSRCSNLHVDLQSDDRLFWFTTTAG